MIWQLLGVLGADILIAISSYSIGVIKTELRILRWIRREVSKDGADPDWEFIDKLIDVLVK